ncbi:MAG: SDR family oxidoreductase [Truepera sp.]|nr:SDR family oxidoreductase [Truepera sp.]
MNLQIAGKVALVTGASQGIGRAVAAGLAAEGVRVVLCARNEGVLSKTVEAIRLAGGEAFAAPGDVSSARSISDLLATTTRYYGAPGILVVNAGGPPPGPAATTSDEAWAKAFELTLMSAVRLSRAVIPAMEAAGWGRIINITSLSVRQPVKNLALSNALRAAVTGFAKTLSTEVAAQGITVNNVAPGYTATERLNELFKDPATKQAMVDAVPAKRLGTPEEVAAAVVFLASRQAAYLTGQTVLVDGGLVGSLL